MDDKTAAQEELLFNRLSKRYRHLKKWARRTGTDAYRLYDRDIPEIPLVLDLYGDAVSGALYKRPYEKDEQEEDAWLSVMRPTIANALEIEEGNVILKERRRIRNRQEGGQYERIRSKNVFRDIHESGLVFRVNLSGYLDTGLFLDARKKRYFIRNEAKGKKFLNLFAYTCSLSVAAAKGGAVCADSVDLSNTYLEWGRVNFALNGIKKFSLIRKDVLQFIAEAKEKKSVWDIISLDPPSFSNSKKMKASLDIKRDHRELIENCLSLLNPGGMLIFSSNAKGFCLDKGDFADYTVKDIGPELEDEDFRRKKTPVCFTIEKRR